MYIVWWKFDITQSLKMFVCYIRCFVISVVKIQYKPKQLISLGTVKIVCYMRYFVISDLFIWSFYCISVLYSKCLLYMYQYLLS